MNIGLVPKKLHQSRFWSKRTVTIFATLTAVDVFFSMLYFGAGMHYISNENGIMENTQALLLALACMVFVRQAFRLRYQQRLLASFFAVLCFAFVFRELDVEKFPVPRWVVFLFAGPGRIFYMLPLVMLFSSLLKELAYFFKDFKSYIRSKVLWYVLISGFLYAVVSELFDKKNTYLCRTLFF